MTVGCKTSGVLFLGEFTSEEISTAVNQSFGHGFSSCFSAAQQFTLVYLSSPKLLPQLLAAYEIMRQSYLHYFH
jgi:hypothetical protein